jgi:hypothetical protein
LAEKESTIERLELQEDTGTPGADHARRRAQTPVSAPRRTTTSLLGLPRAQTCCIMASNGKGFLHEEAV